MADTKRSKLTEEHAAEASRLRELWDSRPHRTQAVFGESYDLGNQANVGHYLNGRSALNPKAAAAFAAELQCSVAEFSPRVAAEIDRLNPTSMSNAPGRTNDATGDFIIAQYDTGGSMGFGFELEEQPPGLIKSWRVDHEWLRMNVRHFTSVKNLCIVTGFGPSMKPKYNPGDPLLCDRGVNVVDTDGVFFFRVGKQGFIKQLQRIPKEDGMVLRAKSFNTDYDPFDITERMDFQVFGKILTAWRSEQL
jgi:hypothetical protein